MITAHLRAHGNVCTTQRREREGYNWYNMDGSVGKDLLKYEENNSLFNIKNIKGSFTVTSLRYSSKAWVCCGYHLSMGPQPEIRWEWCQDLPNRSSRQVRHKCYFKVQCWQDMHHPLKWMCWFLNLTLMTLLLSKSRCSRGPNSGTIDSQTSRKDTVLLSEDSWLASPKKMKCQIWVFPRIGVPQNGWFIMENLIKMDDLGGPPLFLETPIL